MDNRACCAKLGLFKWQHNMDGQVVYIGDDSEATELATALGYVAPGTAPAITDTKLVSTPVVPTKATPAVMKDENESGCCMIS
jgi:hypothetical protein